MQKRVHPVRCTLFIWTSLALMKTSPHEKDGGYCSPLGMRETPRLQANAEVEDSRVESGKWNVVLTIFYSPLSTFGRLNP
jgi:hypothetical protein